MADCESCSKEVFVYSEKKISIHKKIANCESCSKEVFVYSPYGPVTCIDCHNEARENQIAGEKEIKGKCTSCKKFNKIYFKDSYHNSSYNLIQLCLHCSQEHGVLTNKSLISSHGSENFRVCRECLNLFEFCEDKSWAKICFNCWIKKKNGFEVIEEENFSDFQNLDAVQRKCMSFLDRLSIDYNEIKVCHMSPNKFEEDEVYNFYNPKYNTRYLQPDEIVIEIEWKENTLENQNKGMEAIALTCSNLLDLGLNFSVWYAKGMRSPHIRIRGLKELGETENKIKKRLIRKYFTRKVVPFVFHGKIDSSLFSRHKICLEYASHWKHETPFEMLFEVRN